MDEIVLRSMLKWPDVPAVYGLLRLDRRGHWLIRMPASADAGGLSLAGRFERIANPAVTEFIGRNYAADGEGRWYFQNGPQKVFVALDYTPWVYRLGDAGDGFLAHTGARPRELATAFLDEAGMLLLQTELGIGVLLDRDLQAVLERLTDTRGRSVERRVAQIMQGAKAPVRLLGRMIEMAPLRAADVPARFGFDPRPAPRPGEPDC
jgi:hypothetical protein